MDVAIKLTGKTTIKENKMVSDAKGNETHVEESREQFVTFGRQFDKDSMLTSSISRKSIDALKESFRDEMSREDWELIIELKNEQKII
jgi:translation initiation factor 5B